jgi:hypothetical protein
MFKYDIHFENLCWSCLTSFSIFVVIFLPIVDLEICLVWNASIHGLRCGVDMKLQKKVVKLEILMNLVNLG